MGGIISWILSAIQSIGRKSEVDKEDQDPVGRHDYSENITTDPFVRTAPEPVHSLRNIGEARRKIKKILDEGDNKSA